MIVTSTVNIIFITNLVFIIIPIFFYLWVICPFLCQDPLSPWLCHIYNLCCPVDDDYTCCKLLHAHLGLPYLHPCPESWISFRSPCFPHICGSRNPCRSHWGHCSFEEIFVCCSSLLVPQRFKCSWKLILNKCKSIQSVFLILYTL